VYESVAPLCQDLRGKKGRLGMTHRATATTDSIPSYLGRHFSLDPWRGAYISQAQVLAPLKEHKNETAILLSRRQGESLSRFDNP
jgi:hypothetical protein